MKYEKLLPELSMYEAARANVADRKVNVAVSFYGKKYSFEEVFRLIDLLAELLKGLFGYGYWLAGPAMLLAGGILLLHRGRPVALRTAGALLLPLTAGALFHTIFAGGTYPLSGEGVLKSLWTSGIALKAGGAVSGLLAEAAVVTVSKYVSIVLFALLLAGELLAAFRVTPSAILEMVRNRPEYEEEPEPAPAIHITPAEPPRRRGERRTHRGGRDAGGN